MGTKTLTQELQKIENKIQDLEKRFRANEADIEETQERVENAKKRIQELREQYEKKRTARQESLASGKDTQTLNKEITTIREAIELREDEVIGLENKLKKLKEKSPDLIKELAETRDEIPRTKLVNLVPEYNKVASDLAVIVEEMWKLRLALDETHKYGFAVVAPVPWGFGALGHIQKLYLPGDDIPSHPFQQAHFDINAFFEKG